MRSTLRYRPVPWPELLTMEERGIRLFNSSLKLRWEEGLTYQGMCKEFHLSRAQFTKYMNKPPLDFAIQFDYLYGVDTLEVYPELSFLRDRWLEEFKDHLELIHAAADLQNPTMIKELVEACLHGISLYTSPELIDEMKRLRGEAVENAVKAGVQDTRRRAQETYQDARVRKYAEAVNSKTTN